MNKTILSKRIHTKPQRPIKVLQFGEGNFLRAFADCFLQLANDNGTYNGNAVIIKPTSHGNVNKFVAQDCLYNVAVRGMQNGKITDEVLTIDSVSDIINPYVDFDAYIACAHIDTIEFVISNTTEAGIVFSPNDSLNAKPASTFPGKLTQFLYERFCFYSGSPSSGLHIIPCELIENNADMLRNCVLKYAAAWFLPADFNFWLENYCEFHNTLVDRIVSGFPEKNSEEFFSRLGYEDKLLSVAEPFALWVIEDTVHENDKSFNLFGDVSCLPVLITGNCKPYRERKVRILNGAHTSFAMLAWLCGFDYVREAAEDPLMSEYIDKLLHAEIIPCLSMPSDELNSFASDVIERFRNPFMNHALLSISLNSVSKWRTRCLPSLLAYYEKYDKLPPMLSFSLAALLKFYTSSSRETDGKEYAVNDDTAVLEFFTENSCSETSYLVHAYLSQTDFHGMDLNTIPELSEKVTYHIEQMNALGICETFRLFMKELTDEIVYTDK